MPRIAEVAGWLTAAPKPVICLDTCDILEIVECLDWEGQGRATRGVTCIEPAQRLLDTLAVNPDRAQIIITDLVAVEWNQNIAGIRAKAAAFLTKVDEIFGQPYQAAGFAGTVLPARVPVSGSSLVADLEALSLALLNQATRLNHYTAQINLALQRVMNKRRPSHDGHIKDSINFEHYLELARRLRAGGFAEEIVFVSKNKKDYWDGNLSHIHPDLLPEITDAAVGIEFFGSLDAALGFLHI
jgi:hypothetical protein